MHLKTQLLIFNKNKNMRSAKGCAQENDKRNAMLSINNVSFVAFFYNSNLMISNLTLEFANLPLYLV